DPLSEETIDLFHPFREVHRSIEAAEISESEDLLEVVFSAGERRDGAPGIEELRARRRADLDRLDSGVRRLVNPHIYHVSLTRRMKELQLELVADLESRL
ncbi:MAG TPA: nicotinate phosphoribosyltransferase, partial [Acidimicrobiia bacterium]|nr:nicotinate phosphoribosyltransferase [Acidimicrobiia bacterium]